MNDRPRGELGILASLTAAIETTKTDITDIDVHVEPDSCRGTVRMCIPLNDVRGTEHVQIETRQARLTETELQFDLDIEIRTAEADTGGASEPQPTDHGESVDGCDATDRPDPAARPDPSDPADKERDHATTDAPIRSERAASKTDASAGGESVSGDGRARYRDPAELAAVYDENATFDEMKEALGVDVTAQTVRKYMIEYGIHEPRPRPDRLLESIRASELELMNGEQVDQAAGVDDSADTDSENAGE